MYFDYKDYIKESKFYEPMLKDMENDINVFFENYHDDPRFISGWGHNYFCEEDGGKLIYDVKKPFEHKCSICGKIYSDYRVNAVYVTYLRNEAILTIIKSAILYNTTNEKKYLDNVINVVDFYKDNYDKFVVHAKDSLACSPAADVGGAGKIMPQGLNEAIVAIRIINALEIVKEDLDKAWLGEVKEQLFVPMIDLLVPQKQHIHNIPTWINSAIGVVGLFYNDEEWIKEATENPFNIFEQLKNGVTESGFWYEGSIHYNFFALEGIMNFFVFAKTYNFGIDKNYEDIILKMFGSAYNYAFDNDVFPNPSDGWPNIGLKTYSYVYYMAYKYYGEPILKYIKHIEDNELERIRLPLSETYYFENKIPMERLLFLANLDELTTDKPNVRKSESFEASNCALLRSDIFNVFFKYGHQTTSHAHPDKMSIEIIVNNKILTKDLSNSGYGSKMCNEWHRTITAHNTVIVNGKPSDIKNAGELLEYTNNSVKAKCKSYDNVTYERNLEIKENNLYDSFVVNSENEDNLDWFFHFENDIEISEQMLECKLFAEYDESLFIDFRELVAKDNLVVIKSDLVDMKITLEDGMKIFVAKTYNNPANTFRNTIIIRKKAKNAIFKTQIISK